MRVLYELVLLFATGNRAQYLQFRLRLRFLINPRRSLRQDYRLVNRRPSSQHLLSLIIKGAFNNIRDIYASDTYLLSCL